MIEHDYLIRVLILGVLKCIIGLKVTKDTDMSVVSKHTPGFLEIIHKNFAKTLQRMSYPSLLMFDHRQSDKPTEKKVWYSIFFGVGALANASPDTSAKFTIHDGMGDLLVWKVCYNWDLVSIFLV